MAAKTYSPAYDGITAGKIVVRTSWLGHFLGRIRA